MRDSSKDNLDQHITQLGQTYLLGIDEPLLEKGAHDLVLVVVVSMGVKEVGSGNLLDGLHLP